MVKALQRAEQLAVLGAGRVGVDDIPANRQQVLARTGLGSKASALARLGEPKRTATLVAVVRHLEAAAVDDTLDLLALLMATRLFSPARRASAEQRLAMLPRLEKASKTVARAGRAGCCLTSSPLPRTPAPGLMSLRCGRRWSESRRGQSLSTRSIWLKSSCPTMTARRTRRCARHWLAGTTRFGRS